MGGWKGGRNGGREEGWVEGWEGGREEGSAKIGNRGVEAQRLGANQERSRERPEPGPETEVQRPEPKRLSRVAEGTRRFQKREGDGADRGRASPARSLELLGHAVAVSSSRLRRLGRYGAQGGQGAARTKRPRKESAACVRGRQQRLTQSRW